MGLSKPALPALPCLLVSARFPRVADVGRTATVQAYRAVTAP